MVNVKGYLLSATAAALIASSAFSINGLAASGNTSLKTNVTANVKDANESINLGFKVYKQDDLKEESGMGRSMDLVAKVEHDASGKYFATVTIKNASMWKSFKTEVKGQMVEVEKISENKEADTAVVKFEVASLIAPIKSDISIQAGPSLMAHTTFIKFDAVKTPVDYKVYKANDLKEESGMGRSMDQPATIEVGEDGKYYAYFTIKSANLWKSFKTDVNGVMTETEKISENKEANTAVVKAEIPSLDSVIQSDISIQAGPQLLNHTTFIKFDVSKNVESKQFKVWNDKKTEQSSMGKYMATPATVTTLFGKKYADVTISGAQMWQSFKTEVNGNLVEVRTISENKEADTKVVRFELPNGNEPIKSTVAIETNGYKGNYTTYLDFNDAIVPPKVNPNEIVSTEKYNFKLVTKNKKATSAVNQYVAKPIKIEKTKSGEYFATVKLKKATIWKSVKTEVNGKMKAVTTVSTNKKDDTKTVKFKVKSPKAVTKTTFTINAKDKKIAGKYTNYIKVGAKYVAPEKVTVVSSKNYELTALKDNKKETSVTDQYLVKPTKVEKLSNGKYYATVTIKNASWWKSFKTEVNGKLTDVTTVSTNKDKNTKVVKFQIASPSKQVKATIHIKATSPKYEGKYTNYLKFGKEVKK